ncbi:hypothetical protein ASPFODRAFT_610349 [Aspergillus luchuensis CBS 106.47]|uniref:Uncharacterized protein n=1 Tax=Aspergillus luchuensis (strain CBS 106.47) TaxID=1137211 RepID=A0A1M3TIT0_ASPLC|nr:hypothetical protein ASPFODRAFT_610349 [Aspergillus luchuensis CBS 106.47]
MLLLAVFALINFDTRNIQVAASYSVPTYLLISLSSQYFLPKSPTGDGLCATEQGPRSISLSPLSIFFPATLYRRSQPLPYAISYHSLIFFHFILFASERLALSLSLLLQSLLLTSSCYPPHLIA